MKVETWEVLHEQIQGAATSGICRENQTGCVQGEKGVPLSPAWVLVEKTDTGRGRRSQDLLEGGGGTSPGSKE